MSGYYSRLYSNNHYLPQRSSVGYDNIGRPIGNHYSSTHNTSLSPLWPRPTSNYIVSTPQVIDRRLRSLRRGDEMATRKSTTANSTQNNTINNNNKGTTSNNNNTSSTPSDRRNRYTRSSTTASVTQMLSDSCSSLLQRIANRVRLPSTTVDRDRSSVKSPAPRGVAKTPSKTSINESLAALGSTRSRLEDKYSSVLSKFSGRRNKNDDEEHSDHEQTIEPARSKTRTFTPSSQRRSLIKSATTANVLLSEKAYPYVSTSNAREKTPYRTSATRDHYRHHSHYHHNPSHHYHHGAYNEPYYGYLECDRPYYQGGSGGGGVSSSSTRQKSNQRDTKSRRKSSTKTVQTGDRRSVTNKLLQLYPIEIPTTNSKIRDKEKSLVRGGNKGCSPDEATPTPNDYLVALALADEISEREARRKEIQSLIMKYSALDEAYNRNVAPPPPPPLPPPPHISPPAIVSNSNSSDVLTGMVKKAIPSLIKTVPAPTGVVATGVSNAKPTIKNNTSTATTIANKYQHHKDLKLSCKPTSTVSRLFWHGIALLDLRPLPPLPLCFQPTLVPWRNDVSLLATPPRAALSSAMRPATVILKCNGAVMRRFKYPTTFFIFFSIYLIIK